MDRLQTRTPLAWRVLVLTLLAAVGFLLAPGATAQSVGFSGFIKSSYYYDTQQVVAAREGDFLLSRRSRPTRRTRPVTPTTSSSFRSSRAWR